MTNDPAGNRVAPLDPALATVEAAVEPSLAAAGFSRQADLELSWSRPRPGDGEQHIHVDWLESGAVAINLFAMTADGVVHNAPVPALAGRTDATYGVDAQALERAGADLLGPGLRWLEAH